VQQRARLASRGQQDNLTINQINRERGGAGRPKSAATWTSRRHGRPGGTAPQF
jgi:hypothetical protein